jgi:hypothetical protein
MLSPSRNGAGEESNTRRRRSFGSPGKKRGRPVSRILSRGSPPMDDHSSGRPVAGAPQAANPDRWGEAPRDAVPIRHCSRWGLPCHPRCRGRGGLLPHRFTVAAHARRSDLCGAFRRIAPPGRYPAPLLQGVRTFLEPQSRRHPAAIRPSARARTYALSPARQALASAAAMAQSVASSGPARPAGIAAAPRQEQIFGHIGIAERDGVGAKPDHIRARAAAGIAGRGPDRQALPSQPSPVEARAGVAFSLPAPCRNGRSRRGRDAQRARTPPSSSSSASISGAAKGDAPSLSSSIPMEREFTSRARPSCPRPHARRAAPRRQGRSPCRRARSASGRTPRAPDRRARVLPPRHRAWRCNGAPPVRAAARRGAVRDWASGSPVLEARRRSAAGCVAARASSR